MIRIEISVAAYTALAGEDYKDDFIAFFNTGRHAREFSPGLLGIDTRYKPPRSRSASPPTAGIVTRITAGSKTSRYCEFVYGCGVWRRVPSKGRS